MILVENNYLGWFKGSSWSYNDHTLAKITDASKWASFPLKKICCSRGIKTFWGSDSKNHDDSVVLEADSENHDDFL